MKEVEPMTEGTNNGLGAYVVLGLGYDLNHGVCYIGIVFLNMRQTVENVECAT